MLKIRPSSKRSAFTVSQGPQPPTIKFNSDKSKLLSEARQELFSDNTFQSSPIPRPSVSRSNPTSASLDPGTSNKLIVKFNYRRPGQLKSSHSNVGTNATGISKHPKLQTNISTESPGKSKVGYFQVKSATMAQFLAKSETKEQKESPKGKTSEIPRVVMEKGGKITPVKFNLRKESQEDAANTPEVIMKEKNLMLVKLPIKTVKNTRPSVQSVVIKKEKEDPEFQALEKPGFSRVKLAAVDAPTLPSRENAEPDYMEHKPLAQIEPQSGGLVRVKIEPGLETVTKMDNEFTKNSLTHIDVKQELPATDIVKMEDVNKMQPDEAMDFDRSSPTVKVVDPSMIGLARTHAPVLSIGSPKYSGNTRRAQTKAPTTITDYFPRVKKFNSMNNDSDQSASTSSAQPSTTVSETQPNTTSIDNTEQSVTTSTGLPSNVTERKQRSHKRTVSGSKRPAPGPSTEARVKRAVKTCDVLRRGSRPTTSRYRIHSVNILRKNKQNTITSEK